MSTRTSFTPAAIDSLTLDRESKSNFLKDPQMPGLRVEIQKGGSKNWRYRRRIRDTQAVVKVTLGSYPAYSMADARKWARGLNDQVEVGVDPREEARKVDAYKVMTVSKAHDIYMDAVLKG